MSEIVIDEDGTVRGLGDYAFGWQQLGGHVRVRRASHVVFDEAQQEWVARRVDGVVIGRGPTKAAAIEQEIAALQPHVLDRSIEDILDRA